MEKLKEFAISSLYVYTKDDYLENPMEMDKIMCKIYLTHESKDANVGNAFKDVHKKNVSFFDESLYDAKLYVLKNRRGAPISFAICSSNDEEASWHIEYICTDKKFASEGYGEILTREIASDLQKQGIAYLTCIVNANNFRSLAMLNSFAKNSNIMTFRYNLQGDRFKYEFDISKINEDKNEKNFTYEL